MFHEYKNIIYYNIYMSYKEKYVKYKIKYINLKKQYGGNITNLNRNNFITFFEIDKILHQLNVLDNIYIFIKFDNGHIILDDMFEEKINENNSDNYSLFNKLLDEKLKKIISNYNINLTFPILYQILNDNFNVFENKDIYILESSIDDTSENVEYKINNTILIFKYYNKLVDEIINNDKYIREKDTLIKYKYYYLMEIIINISPKMNYKYLTDIENKTINIFLNIYEKENIYSYIFEKMNNDIENIYTSIINSADLDINYFNNIIDTYYVMQDFIIFTDMYQNINENFILYIKKNRPILSKFQIFLIYLYKYKINTYENDSKILNKIISLSEKVEVDYNLFNLIGDIGSTNFIDANIIDTYYRRVIKISFILSLYLYNEKIITKNDYFLFNFDIFIGLSVFYLHLLAIDMIPSDIIEYVDSIIINKTQRRSDKSNFSIYTIPIDSNLYHGSLNNIQTKVNIPSYFSQDLLQSVGHIYSSLYRGYDVLKKHKMITQIDEFDIIKSIKSDLLSYPLIYKFTNFNTIYLLQIYKSYERIIDSNYNLLYEPKILLLYIIKTGRMEEIRQNFIERLVNTGVDDFDIDCNSFILLLENYQLLCGVGCYTSFMNTPGYYILSQIDYNNYFIDIGLISKGTIIHGIYVENDQDEIIMFDNNSINNIDTINSFYILPYSYIDKNIEMKKEFITNYITKVSTLNSKNYKKVRKDLVNILSDFNMINEIVNINKWDFDWFESPCILFDPYKIQTCDDCSLRRPTSYKYYKYQKNFDNDKKCTKKSNKISILNPTIENIDNMRNFFDFILTNKESELQLFHLFSSSHRVIRKII